MKPIFILAIRITSFGQATLALAQSPDTAAAAGKNSRANYVGRARKENRHLNR